MSFSLARLIYLPVGLRPPSGLVTRIPFLGEKTDRRTSQLRQTLSLLTKHTSQRVTEKSEILREFSY